MWIESGLENVLGEKIGMGEQFISLLKLYLKKREDIRYLKNYSCLMICEVVVVFVK